ncbi:MAG: TPM domain-containing protein [Burkholderiales bacterium]
MLRVVAAFVPMLALLPAYAQDLQPLPEVRAPVVDSTKTLTIDQVERLSALLRAFEQRKGSQISIVFVPTTRPESIEQYSIRLAERVKAGRSKVDDGVLILVAVQDRKTRIEVGYGLEGAIPDIVANQIRREVINPYFRNNDFYGGVRAGAEALIKRIDGESLPPAWHEEAGSREPNDLMRWVVVAIVMIVALGGFLRRIFGRFIASGVVASIAGGGAWMLTSVAAIGGLAGVLAFGLSLLMLGRVFDFGSGRGGHRGGWSAGSGGGSWSGGGSSSGDWSGGGGGFGGGGASGSWDD